jgi:hypothetical protein
MRRRIPALVFLVIIAAALSGCTKCGFIWEQGPRACHSDAPK